MSSGETWLLNNVGLSVSLSGWSYSISFTSNNQSYSTFACQFNSPNDAGIYYGDTKVYDSNTLWTNTAYRTVTFETAPTGDLLTWLQANGTKQGGSSGYNLTINYSTVPMSTAAAYIKINSDTVSSSNYDYVVQPGTSSTNPTLKNSAGTTLTVPYVVPNVEKVAFMGGLAIAVGGSTNNTSPYTLTADTTISPGVYGPTADTPIDEPTI